MTAPSARLARRIATAIAACTILASCATGGTGTAGGGGNLFAGTFHAPDVTITPADKSQGVAPSTVVSVTSSGGNIASVIVTQTGTTTTVPGTLNATKRTWTAAAGLSPSATYSVKVLAEGQGGMTTDASASFTTTGGQHLLTGVVPADGVAVGVGMPIKLTFNTPIPDALESALVARIKVTSDPPQQGDWHWFSPTEVHWRPATFWQPHTHVTLAFNLLGVNAGNDFWGYDNWTQSFTVGDKHYSEIDHNTEMMTVYTNDQLVNTIPVSLGKAGFPTLSGTLVVWYKSPQVMMDSCASGIDCIPGTQNYYKEYVYWDTAISTDGFFIHDAYWDVSAQGHYDYSHGCVNVSAAAAQWFFNYSAMGDVVVVKNTARQADAGDGEGDWQIPFDQWANSSGAPPAAPASSSPGGA